MKIKNVQDILSNADGKFDLENYMSKIEKDIIEKILKRNNYNVSKTARELSISRQNLQYKIKIHKIIEVIKICKIICYSCKIFCMHR